MLKWLKTPSEAIFGRTKLPTLTPNTFIVWEPCSRSHAEVIPGYVRYLLDLGFDVLVLATPARFDEGLFERFSHPRVHLARLPQAAIRHQLRRQGLAGTRGILVTTARKISGLPNYNRERQLFANRKPAQRLLLVEHDIKPAADQGTLTPDIITLRAPHYRNAATTVVNPHYFGTVKFTGKNPEITQFITIGAMRGKRRNTRQLIGAVARLHDAGVTRFRVVVIGRGSLRGVPAHLRHYFVLQGRVDFATLYAQMEAADFFLTLLDPDNPAHERYITTGTSGSFQLILGFAKPCLIARKFANVNGFNDTNSIIYDNPAELAVAMTRAVDMDPAEYTAMQTALKTQAATLYQQSLANLKRLIET